MDDVRAGERFAPRVVSWQLLRPRLVDRIEAGCRDGLVIVRGPVGGGKTLAVAEWVTRTSRSTSWITVHSDNSSRFALWASVVRAVGGPGADGALASLDARSEPHLRAALAEAFAEEPHVIVLDDYQLVTDERIHHDISWLIQATGCSVVAVTRTALPFETGALAARVGPVVIDGDELRFTADESAALLTSRSALDPEAVTTAYEHLRGWPLATRALELEFARSGAQLPIASAIATVIATLSADHPEIPSVLEDADALAFATRVSIADRLTLDLARALAPEAIDAGQLLGDLEVAGLGAWRDGPNGESFELQPFLRGALRERLGAGNADELRAVQRAYAEWADSAGLPVLAGQQAVELADWALLARITRAHFRTIMIVHRAEWSSILAAVPYDRLQRHPVLGGVLVQLLNTDSGGAARMRAITTMILSSMAPIRESGTTPDRIWRNGSALAAERISGRYAAAARTATRIATLIDELTPQEHAELEGILPLLYVHIGTTRLYEGDLVGATAALHEALNTENESQWSHLHARSLLALVAALRGDMPTAAAHADALERDIAIPEWRGTYSAAGYHLARALQHVERWDATAAREEVEQLDRHYDTIEHWPLMVEVRSLIALIDGSAAVTAWSLAGKIRARSRRSQTSAAMRDSLAAVHADLLLAAGEVGAAETVLSHADHPDAPDVVAAAARTALARGDDARAVVLSSRLINRTELGPRVLSGAFLVRAIALSRSANVDEGRLALEHALRILDAHGLALPLALVPRAPLEELPGTAGELVRQRLALIPDSLPRTRPRTRLSARELAVLRELVHTPGVRDIADQLYVSPNTVKTQVRTLYRKLGVANRSDALATAAAWGLLSED